ncbi:hypothetical protein MSG28_015951 [Choristoneura fumiferana]|uniref:Uncharacterized protein n=1 Tax=Choristoneura fumiferana TaxID=7141 RepID=A0ACC0K5B2_CHOFU|nr:hypothetical protein MSG28_015951 [Choristoneura fumiferana]
MSLPNRTPRSSSQYIAAADARREWLSGLSGSSGTAVLTADHALVWTDARYFTQFYHQVDTTQWELMRQGRPSNQKIADLLQQIADRGASALVLTALDDVAYTLNLRGSDIPYNPVFFAYLTTDNIILFWGDGVLPESLSTTSYRSAAPFGYLQMEVTLFIWLQKLEEQDAMGASFATIAGAGENGAIIHYKADPEGEQRVITRDDMLLVDSGGQYRDGTTDITRTRHMSSSPTDMQRLAFTRGNVLETLARKALWDVGLNYAHGTGHGVGHFLNVHEGPAWILSSLSADDPGIVPKMIFSNEPGFYEVGEYGIRHEDVVEVIELNKDSDHIQIKFINDYHARVLSTLGPILLERNLHEDYTWLERECAPIYRSSAILLTATPLLALLSVARLFM